MRRGDPTRRAPRSAAKRFVAANLTSGLSEKLAMMALLLPLAGCDFDTLDPGIEVSAQQPLITSEDGASAQFTIVLSAKPDAMVTIPIQSSNPDEGIAVFEQVVFSASNWSTPVAVRVSGVDDDTTDGDVSYSIALGPSRSGDRRYDNLSVNSIAAVNRDNEGPSTKPDAGLVITPADTVLETSEAGTSVTFSVALATQPASDVVINAASSNTGEGTVSPSSRTFTSSNWETPQTFTITGADDTVVDGTQNYTINLSAQSADLEYNVISAAVSVSNADNDTPSTGNPGVNVAPSNVTTSETGTIASFSVVLNAAPSADVNISITSSDTSEGAVSPATLVFTTANWNVSRSVSVTGVDDSVDDGNINYSINLSVQSADTAYNSMAVPPISAVNQDNDTASVLITPSNGLVTTEAGGTAQFTARLTSQSTDTVTIAISSSDTSEGTVSPASLNFSATNWNVAQTVTITGVDDTQVDNDVNYQIRFGVQSNDASYNLMSVQPVAVTNQDNDVATPAGVTVTPSSNLQTSENLTTASFTVVLNTQPTATVTVGLTSSDTTEGTVSPANLTFTTANWNVAQTVTVTGVNDSLADGDVSYEIRFALQSSDTGYNGLSVTPVSAINQDNDTVGLTVNPADGLVTTEALGSATFTVTLRTQPAGTVTVGLTSSDTTEGTVSPVSLTFTTANWNTAQTVTVRGVNDFIVDGSVPYNIAFNVQSSDTAYNGLSVTPVGVTNQDNDTANLTVTPAGGLQTSENLTTATFTVVLTSQPASTVTVGLTSSDTTEGTVSPASLTFTTANWNTAQTVTVTGVNDTIVDGNVAYTITFTVQSSDTAYSGLSVTPVGVTNQDNDVATPAGVTVTPSSNLQTSENLTTAGFTVVLNRQPTATVTVGLTSSDTTEGTVSPASLTFTTANWNSAQPVTVTGVNDFIVDGNVAYNIAFTVQSSDTAYSGLSVTPVSVTNQDNDTANLTATPPSGLQTSEDLTTATFSVVLTSQPTSTVTVTLTSSDTTEATVSPASLSFSTANWNSARMVTLTGVDDATVDGNIAYTVNIAVQSTDSNYNGLAVTPVSAVNLDNDSVTQPPSNYTLYIEPGIIDIAASTVTNNGATQLPAMGYSTTPTPSGRTPGPVIEAVVGQTTTIEVVNDHINPHRFEIQGLLTNTPELAPGETRQFQITPTTAGVYLYGDPQLIRRALGLQGAVVVRPAGNPNTAWTGGPAFDQERVWVVADFDETWLRSPSTINVNQYNPNYFLMNGMSGFAAKEDPATNIDGVVGETFLIRIVNAGQYDQSLHFHSNHFQIISEGGFNYTNLADAPMVTTVNVKRGSTAMVLFTLSQTGAYPVHVHTAQMETSNGVYLNGTVTHIIGR